jgi:hypothetical protein
MEYGAEDSLLPIQHTLDFKQGETFMVEDAGEGLFGDHFWYLKSNPKTNQEVGLVILVDDYMVQVEAMEVVEI